MKLRTNPVLCSLLIVSFCGCGKEDSAPAPAVDAATNTAASPSQPAPQFITANARNEIAQNVAGEVNPFLTEQLGIFIRQKGRLPQSFQELAAARLDSVPVSPVGTKWVIDGASRQVKAVKAD
jgi:hypothetical protein